MMLLPLPLIAIGPKPRSLRSSRVAQLIDLLINATTRQRRNKRLTAPHADGKFVPVDLAFLPPRSSRQNSAGGCLDTRNRKEVSGAALYFMEFLFQHLDFAGHGILSVRQGEPRCQTKYRLRRSMENSGPTSLLHMSAAIKSGRTNCPS